MSTGQETRQGQSETGHYQSSEAFASVILAQNESVNPNTGTLNFFKSVIKLRGKRESINFVLDVSYSPGSAGIFGLPNGWGLKLAYVVPGASVTVGGRTYAIDFGWQDTKNYKSGLRYLNDHGVKFELKIPPLPLPSGRRGEYKYRLIQGDGSVDYFDATGKLLEHDDLFGNHLYYSYAIGRGGPQNFLLDVIEDSWGQKIQFKYQPGSQMIIIAPDQGKTTLNLSNQGIQTIVDPIGLTTRFQYDTSPVGGTNILTQITYPTGLVSRFSYDRIQYLDRDGISKYMPAVVSHRHSQTTGAILVRTDYHYGSRSGGNTFTGARVGCRLGGLRDNLVDGSAKFSGYRYDVIKIRFDESEKQLAVVICWFNHLHLPVQQIDQTADRQGKLADTFRTDFEYKISSDEHARSPSYSKPSAITRSRNMGSGQTYQPMTRASIDYNDFGNVTATQHDMYVPGSEYVKQQTSLIEYTTTKWNGQENQMPLTESTRDEISGSERRMQYTLSMDQKMIQKTVVSFITGLKASQEPQPWKTQQYEYDQYGRMTVNTIGWSVKPSSLPTESPSSSTTKSGYDFKDGILVEITTDPLGNKTVASYDMRVTAGPVVRRLKPMGQAETFEYDLLGRVTKHIDFLGHETQTVNPNVDSPNAMKVTDFLGHTVLTTFDALGRTIKVEDNGDPTSTSTDPVRVVSETKYDCLSQPKEKTDMLGLTTKYTVDALSRPLQTAGPDGNITSYEYDDLNGTVTEKINGDIRIVSYLDGRSRTVRRVRYPDSSGTSENKCLEMATTYDGNDRRVREVASYTSRTRSFPAVNLKKVMLAYNADSDIVSKTEIGTTSVVQDRVHREYTLDLFGNHCTYTKQTTYSNGTDFSNKGPLLLYDQANRFVALQNQLGHKEQHEYDGNSLLTKTIRFDGTTISYEYDTAGQAVKIASPTRTIRTEYVCIGRKARVTQDEQTMNYEYTRDGTLKSATFEDGGKQVYGLDKFSRVVQDTDVHGVVRQITFDDKGRVASRSCQGDTYSYSYGLVNHTESQLIGVDLDGASKYRRTFEYDAFGQVKRETFTGPASTIFLDTTYTFDAKQQLSEMQSQSNTCPHLDVKRQYVYDGIGQLVQDSTQSSVKKYAYDGNSNIISVDTNGQIKQMTYNAIDQRADPGFEYDKNGRMVKDDLGQQYTFDDQDRLLRIQTSGGMSSVFGYHPDDLLAKNESSGKTSLLYYNSEQNVNAIRVADLQGKDSTTSLFSNGDRLIAGYSNSSSSTYLLDQRGSTALFLDGNQSTGLTYDAYGSVKDSTSSLVATTAGQCSSSFKFQQEYHDDTTGLVYLRARFYDPHKMAFISLDSSLKENRYAYCSGDPINLVDPSGRSWTAYVLSFSVGVVVGIAATALAGPVVGAALGEGTAAVIVTSMVGGAVGNLAAGAVAADIDNLGYGLSDIGRDLAVGAVGGLVGSGAGLGTSMALSRTLGGTISQAATTLTSTTIGTSAGAAAATVFEDWYEGREIDWENVALNVGVALVFGYLMGNAASRAPRGGIPFQNTTRPLPKGAGSFVGEVRSRLLTASSMSDSLILRPGDKPKVPNWTALLGTLTSFCKPNPNLHKYFDPDDEDSNHGPGRSVPLLPLGRA